MRKGNWVPTHTGKMFYLLDPRPEDIDIQDIAHHLARLCRFNGAGQSLYSVAQHCCIVAQECSPSNKLHALLHDAAEAYIGDMVHPIKILPELAFYREVEQSIMSAVAVAFGLESSIMPEEVACADLVARRTEARDLGIFSPEWEISDVQPWNFTITPLDPCKAEVLFLNYYHQYKKG